MIWKILEIEKTKNEEVIKNAYREKLRRVNPEDDQEGFMELRKAYEEAMQYATLDEESLHNIESEGTAFCGTKNEVDLWIDKIDVIYQDVKSRIDKDKWNALLKDSVCDNLDTELEAGEKLLVYFMSHSFLPQDIWMLVDKRFGYVENMESLKEKFPENYLEYVKWQIQRPGFIDYTMFDGETDKAVDEYINKLYELKAAADDKDLSQLKQALKEIKRYDISHPFARVEEAKCYLLEAETGEEEQKQEFLEQALTIMEDVEFEFSQNAYIERIYGETLIANGKIEQAKAIYDALLEEDETNYMAALGVAKCVFLGGNPEEAKEQVEDVLEERVQDADSLALLEEINKVLVERYEKQIQEERIPDICYKLGWCYYQQKRFDEGIQLLKDLGNSEEYDYVNLCCRLYLASDNYACAFPWAKKWLKLIEESEDDGSKEMTKRKNRLSLAYYSIGICYWENVFKKSAAAQKEDAKAKVIENITKAIAEEHNVLVQFSYKEQLARFYLDAEAYEECVAICDEIIARDRGFFPAYVHRQKAYYKLKRAKEVIDDYYACIEIYPGYAPPYVLAAEIFEVFNQYDDVEQVLETAKEAGLESDMLELYRIHCIHYKEFSRENTEQALVQMKKLRYKVRNSAEGETDVEDLADLEREYAVLYWDLDETQKAIEIVEEYLERHADSEIMVRLQADIFMGEQRYVEALMACQHLLRMNQQDLRARHMMGNCYEYQEKMKAAMTHYRTILEMNPDYAPTLRRMMYIYSHLSDKEEGLEKCKKAIEYATRFIDVTDSAEGYLERGNLYIDLYELEKAVEDCKSAIERDSEAYYAYNNLGCALLKLRRVEEAIVPLQQAVELDPDRDHLPYLNLAECYVLQKQYDKAVAMYEEVIRLRTNKERWNREIAKIYVKSKEYDKAIAIYKEWVKPLEERRQNKKLTVLTLDEMRQLAEHYCKLGEIYRQAGQMETACDCYEKAYKLMKKTPALLIDYMGIAVDIAEFYRDIAEYDKAYKILRGLSLFYYDKKRTSIGDYKNYCFVMATVCFELQKKTKATKYANKQLALQDRNFETGEFDLEDRRYRPARLYNHGIMYICKGDLAKAKKYIRQIKECNLCVMCETCDCFEYYFGMGLISELEGNIEEAKKLYTRALEIKPNYPCCKNHLEKLKS